MIDAIYLPKLNNLTPTMESTLLKAVEEAGELARAVLNFLPYEQMTGPELHRHEHALALLQDVAKELLDVAQTCVTMIFVMEDCYAVTPDLMIGEHLMKLQAKGYRFDANRTYRITTADNFKYLQLPRLSLADVTLLKTVCKIQEELGELTQYLGKRAGASGEGRQLPPGDIINGCALELLDVAQCCFTMMYILAEQYSVDVKALLRQHVAKLRTKGYCA